MVLCTVEPSRATAVIVTTMARPRRVGPPSGAPFTETLVTLRKHKGLSYDDARATVLNGGMHYFTMIKQLTLFGFFTSEVGATKVLRHLPIPGGFDGDLAYKVAVVGDDDEAALVLLQRLNENIF